jgi:hypothetical protein
MKKPENLKTAHFVCGINVLNKDVVNIPEHLVNIFKNLGFKEVNNGTEMDSGNRDKEGSVTQAIGNSKRPADSDELAGQNTLIKTRRRDNLRRKRRKEKNKSNS